MTINHKVNLLMPWNFRIILVFLALLQPQVVLAAGSPICFSDVTIRPGTALDISPTIDGIIQGDGGWLNAWRNVFHNGTPTHSAVIQAIKDSSNIYLSFEVNNDVEWNTDDEIVLTINPGGTSLKTYIRIFPVVPPYAPTPGTESGVANPIVIEWAQSSTGSAWPTPAHMPVNADNGANGRAVAVSTSGIHNNRSWAVELKLPMAVFGIPPAGEFAMYINVLPNKNGLVTEYPFPSNSFMFGDDLNTPAMATWATAKTNANSCSGVYIEVADIYTDNIPPDAINTTSGSVNRFHAVVHNTSIDSNGNFIQANKVNATFSVAQFGLGGGWKTIPTHGGTAPNNPTLPANILGNSTHDFTLDWTLSPTERTTYLPPHDHQCILVDLESSKGACVGGTTSNAECITDVDCGGGGVCQPTIFSVRSMYRNMNFAALSNYASKPVIDTSKWKAPSPGQNHQVELMVTKQIDTLNRDLVRQWISKGNLVKEGSSDVKLATGAGRREDLKEFSDWPAARDKNYEAFVAQLANPSAQVSQLTYLVHGCRHSGKFIKIHSNKYEICEDVGSFGYVFRHAGIGEAKFDVAVDGPDLKKMEGPTERYQVSVAPEKSVQLSASFNAESVTQPPPCPCPSICSNVKTSLLGNDNKLAGTEFLWVGIAGVGAFAFARRRNKSNKQ